VAEASGRRWVGETHAGGSFLSAEDPRVHFGLGDSAQLERLSVRFPDGARWQAEGVQADRHLVVRAGVAEPIERPAPQQAAAPGTGTAAGSETGTEAGSRSGGGR